MWKSTAFIFVCISALGCRDAQDPPQEQPVDPRVLLMQQQVLALQQEIQGRSNVKNNVLVQLSGHHQMINTLRSDSSALAEELRSYGDEVRAYLMNHKLATACLGAVGVALSDDNQFSEDARNIGETVTVICTVAFLANSDFRTEVINVGDYFVQAGAHAKDLQSHLESVQNNLWNEKGRLVAEQARVDTLDMTIQTLQLQLDSLNSAYPVAR